MPCKTSVTGPRKRHLVCQVGTRVPGLRGKRSVESAGQNVNFFRLNRPDALDYWKPLAEFAGLQCR